MRYSKLAEILLICQHRPVKNIVTKNFAGHWINSNNKQQMKLNKLGPKATLMIWIAALTTKEVRLASIVWQTNCDLKSRDGC